MTNEHDDQQQDAIDDLGRRAGAELRRPAPADGLTRVESGRRRRRISQTVAGASAVAVVAIGAFVVVDRSGNDDEVVTNTVPSTTAADSSTSTSSSTPSSTTDPAVVPPPSEPTTTETTPTMSTPTTSTPTTSTPTPTTTPATTPAPAPAGWSPTTEEFPTLSYIACCGTNWEEGEPSPTIPSDPDQALPPGLYQLQQVDDRPADDDFTDGVLELEVRGVAPCNQLAEFECEGEPPYADNVLGVPFDAARTVDLPLDDTVEIALSGFACANDQLSADRYIGAGSDLATLMDDFTTSYETAVAAPLRDGADPAQLAASLAADQTAGFSDPGCPSYTSFAWQSPDGPGLIAFLPLTPSNDGSAVDPGPASGATILFPTALEVGDDGRNRVYVYAGFLS